MIRITSPGPGRGQSPPQPGPPAPLASPPPAIAPRPGDAGFDEEIAAFQAPGIRLRVNQDHNWVSGRTSPNATVWITLTDRLGAVKGTNSTTARGDGWFDPLNVYDGGQPVDIAPTDVVQAASSDGSTGSVAILAMSGLVDADANTVSGVIEGGVFPARVRGEVWVEDGPNVYGMTDSTGHYVIDFSPFDLQRRYPVAV